MCTGTVWGCWLLLDVASCCRKLQRFVCPKSHRPPIRHFHTARCWRRNRSSGKRRITWGINMLYSRHLFVGHRICLHDFQSPKFVENNPPCSERTSLHRFLASTQYSTHTQVARKLNSTAAGYNYREWTCPILKVLVFAAFVARPWMTTPHKITQHSSGKLHIQSGAKGKRSVPSEALRKLQPCLPSKNPCINQV